MRKKGFFPDVKRITALPNISDDIQDTVTDTNIQHYFPELTFSMYSHGDSNINHRALINLYLYIKLMQHYQTDVFKLQ